MTGIEVIYIWRIRNNVVRLNYIVQQNASAKNTENQIPECNSNPDDRFINSLICGQDVWSNLCWNLSTALTWDVIFVVAQPVFWVTCSAWGTTVDEGVHLVRPGTKVERITATAPGNAPSNSAAVKIWKEVNMVCHKTTRANIWSNQTILEQKYVNKTNEKMWYCSHLSLRCFDHTENTLKIFW